MNQQINLYQPIFRKQKKVFSAVAMLQVSLVTIALFILAGGYSYIQLKKMDQQANVASANLSRVQRQFNQLIQQSSNGAAAKLLAAEGKRLNSEIDQKKAIVALLAKGPYINKTGFSRQFEALARQHVDGTWLTGIDIEQGGASLNLKGITYSAELVPVYLQKLLQEKVFSGTKFNVLGMERSDKKPEELSFQISTKTAGKPNGSS